MREGSAFCTDRYIYGTADDDSWEGVVMRSTTLSEMEAINIYADNMSGKILCEYMRHLFINRLLDDSAIDSLVGHCRAARACLFDYQDLPGIASWLEETDRVTTSCLLAIINPPNRISAYSLPEKIAMEFDSYTNMVFTIDDEPNGTDESKVLMIVFSE